MSRAVERSRVRAALILGGATVACAVGWRTFLFLTDDAFIAFRYVSNRQLGHGYTWNVPPFLPVEGYTSFLWLGLLDAVWSIVGVEPPAAANALTLVFSIGTLLVTAALARRLLQARERESDLDVFLALVLLGVVSNRTFLAWASSGLETALFNLLLHLWLLLALSGDRGRTLHGVAWALTASLLALARPDGYLFVVATALVLGVEARRGGGTFATWAAMTAPLLVVPVHVLWRRWFYGEWLPNTYYAKVVGAWPEAGIRYLAAFVLEYGLWFWALFVGAAALRRLSRPPRLWTAPQWGDSVRPAVALGALAVHLGYYTLVVGGDHFEFRVYSHLVPLIFLGFLWSLLVLGMPTRPAAAAFAVFLLVGWVIPWTHWAHSRTLVTRQETHMMRVHVADHLPFPLRAPAVVFDGLEDWLIERHVGMRHQEHKVFCLTMLDSLPSRREGSRVLENEPNPVAEAPSVGVVGWVLPHVHVIDMLGLNDYVIARSPVPEGERRAMAHDRRPPSGYLEAFRPNLLIDAFGQARRFPRTVPLTNDDVRQIEHHFRAGLTARAGEEVP